MLAAGAVDLWYYSRYLYYIFSSERRSARHVVGRQGRFLMGYGTPPSRDRVSTLASPPPLPALHRGGAKSKTAVRRRVF